MNNEKKNDFSGYTLAYSQNFLGILLPVTCLTSYKSLRPADAGRICFERVKPTAWGAAEAPPAPEPRGPKHPLLSLFPGVSEIFLVPKVLSISSHNLDFLKVRVLRTGL